MNFDFSNIEDIRHLFFLICFLLFIGVAVYLYINLKSNRKRIGRRSLMLKKSVKKNDEPPKLFDVHYPFYNAIPIPLCRVNIKGEIEVFNKAFARLLPLTSGSIKHQLIGDLFDDKLAVFFRRWYDDPKNITWNREERVMISNEIYRININYFEKSDSDTAYILISFETDNEPTIVTNNGNEVNAIIKGLIKDSSIAILLLNKEGIILVDNHAACTLYGNEELNLRGKNIREVLPVEFQDSIKSNYNKLFSGDKFVFRGVLSNDEGSLIPVSVSVVGVKVGNEDRSLFFIDDISLLLETENKLIEAQKKVEQSDLLKTSFLANMSHEIRTPLNAILGFSELLNDPSIGETDRSGFVRHIKQSGESLLDLITGIINFSRISSGAVSILKKRIDLENLFIRLQRFAVKTNKLKSKPIDIRINIPIGGVDCFLFSDEEKVFQFFKNLIDNAIKFTYSGSVEFGCRERGKGYLEFFVKDTGIGIPEESRKIIFDRFVQGDDSSNREFGGTGIGLSISAELVRLLGGYLWIESTVDVGSCFNVVLPKDFSFMNPKRNIQYFSGESMGKSILVVDEMEESYTDFLGVSVSKQQQSFWAQNIREANNIVLSNKIDLILVNGNSYSEGEELTQFITSTSKTTPVLSFNNRVLGVEKCMHLESYPFTEKGIMMLNKRYLQSRELSANSNSISI